MVPEMISLPLVCLARVRRIACALVVLLGVSAVGTAAQEEQTAPDTALPEQIDVDTALRLALEHNYAIRQARARYNEATGALTESKAGQLPTVSVSAGYTRIDEGRFQRVGGVLFGNPDSWQAGIRATQNLYTGGAVSSAIRASRASLESVEAEFDSVLRDELVAVRERYLGVLLAREQLKVREQSVALLEEELETARKRVEVGTGSPFEQLRAEVALANGQPPLIRARNAYRLAAVELFRVIGVPAPENAEERIDGELAFVPDSYTLEAMLAAAMENRTELQQLEKLVEAAESSIELAKAGARPNVGVFAGYDVESVLPTDTRDYSDGWSVGITGSWNIWDGRATRGRVAQAQARFRQARLRLEETRLLIDAEVRRAFSSYTEAMELVRSSEKVVEQATESLRMARARFEAGGATQLDVLQAQVALTEAGSNKAQALHDANLAHLYLLRAAGLLPMPGEVTVAGQ
ncbi:MAG: TolC family protein [Verrucomicrobia bacterium]|nr:MAG: TolC family protein [Verrucomicrobiota bacterium]